MIWTPRKSILPLLVHSTMPLPFYNYCPNMYEFNDMCEHMFGDGSFLCPRATSF
jgi:hypothetical protein